MLLAEGGDPWAGVVQRGGSGSLDQQWGPDAYGYRAKNQQETGGPTPQWLDIVGLGSQITGLQDDNVVGPLPIGFNFHYYWYDVDEFSVGSNGYIKFSTRGQIASPFVQFPNAAPPNDVVGVYVTDWVFGGATDSSRCYAWSNAVDTLVVAFLNVPAYSGAGSHNFEIILSGVDSSITFQYGDQIGTASGAVAVGIENLSGTVGLNTLFGTHPTSNTAIRFEYPDTVTYTNSSLAVAALQNPLSNGFFVQAGDTVRPWLQIADMGNQPQPACSVSYSIRRLSTGIVASFDTVLGVIEPSDTLTLTPSLRWQAVDTGAYLAEARVSGTFGSNTARTEFHVVTLPGELAYDDGGSDRPSSWTGANRGVAMEFVPPAYPVTVSQTRLYVSSGSGAYDVALFHNDGPNGSPGTEFWRHHFTGATTGWNAIAVPRDSGLIQDGSFFVAYYTPASFQFGVDTTSAQGFSHRCWEFVNSWGQNKFWNIGDLMIRCSLRPIYPPPGPFTRTVPANGATVPWMQGLVRFAWTPSLDPGTTVSYHLNVSSGDYHRTFVTPDTMYYDSLSWFYGGFPRADVTWTVWATNGQDSVQATNGQGFFHLNANHAPGAFSRVAPRDTLQPLAATVVCRWSHSTDVDSDPVRYVFHIEQRPGSYPVAPHDTVTSDTLVTVRIPIPVDPLAVIHNFYWTVRATDIFDTTNASNGEGHFTMDIPAGTGDLSMPLITEYALSSYPNPFNSTAAISYDLPHASTVELRVYNLMGEQVALLQQGYRAPGRYRIEWNAAAQGSGTYFAVLKAGNTTKIQKLLLMK
jgi:hypothetical protein